MFLNITCPTCGKTVPMQPVRGGISDASPDPIVGVIHAHGGTIKDIKVYRREHGCDLKTAKDAVGACGTRFLRVSEVMPKSTEES